MSVGTRAIPSRFIRATSSSVRKMPCSMEVIPASMQLAIPWEPWARAAAWRPAFVASSMAARTSSSVSLARPGSPPGGLPAPRGEDLDDLGPRLELLPDGPAHVIGAVGLAAEPPAVAAGHANAPPGGEDPRPRDQPLADGAPDGEPGVLAPPPGPRSSTTAAMRAPSTTTALPRTGWAPLPSISVAPLRISRSPACFIVSGADP